MNNRFRPGALLVVLWTLLLGCQPKAGPAPEVTGSASVGPAGNPVSACQRIDEPGQYVMSEALEGAPTELSTQVHLDEPYVGSRSLDRACIEIAASDVTLDCEGYMLTGSGGETDPTAGIAIVGSDNSPLRNVTIANCGISAYQFGIFVSQLEGGAITGNTARRNHSIGFYLKSMSQVTITGNTVEGNDPDGMLLVGVVGVTVSDNVAFYNRMRGITFEGCTGCVAVGNESFSHGVLGFAIYASQDMRLADNKAHDNRYHGFAILHEAGSTTFENNESYNNEGVGFYLESSQGNTYLGNLSHDNRLDGMAVFSDSPSNTFQGNELRDNGGYGMLVDSEAAPALVSDNTFSGNAQGPTGSVPDSLDSCIYTGFGTDGPCDPVFEGGPNLKDPEAEAASPAPVAPNGGDGSRGGAHIVGPPVSYPSMGDLWMPTWADDDRLYLSWGDGTGFGDGYPLGYPDYQTGQPVSVTFCPDDAYAPEVEGYFPCWLWCNINSCSMGDSYPTAALTDTGVLAFEGPVPDFTGVDNIAIDVPDGQPFFLSGPDGTLDVSGRNDKPSSLLFVDGRLYLAAHSPAGFPEEGYLAYSEDYGHTWTEIPGSPWGADSNFRVLMLINMGQNYGLNQDGYVYALGVGTEAAWTERSVYLTRVARPAISSYGAYEYFAGMEGGEPRWSPDQTEAAPLDDLFSTGQASAMYHDGTGRYLFLTTDAGISDGLPGRGALFAAPQPWGPWSQVTDLCFVPECDDGSHDPAWTDGKYIAGLIPKDAGPDYVYFTIAGGDLHYQLQIGRLELSISP